MNLLSRKQAAADGRKYYWTGVPCVHGHVSKRLVSTRRCSACQHKEDARRYKRDKAAEQARSRNYQRCKLPAPTRPCPPLCELCGNPPKTRALCLDHDHETGHFRGWLCTSCNLALGRLGDNRDAILNVLAYLEGQHA